ncbi:MAG: cytosine permease [Thermaerobacter sp.]|nr:cytosine permease [Thermaerobacter sp.]
MKPEVYGIDPIPTDARHGKASSLFTLWFAANLGIPAWFLGVLGLSLGLGTSAALTAVVIGSAIGAALLAFASRLGPRSGLAQLPQSRSSFGRRGAYLPAVLNWVSCLGWFAVNSVLGGELTAELLHLPFALGLALLSLVQVVIAFVGHDTVHRVERYVSLLLFATFAFFSWKAVTGGVPVLVHGGFNFGSFALEVAVTASYLFSWAPYASDYSRYLPATESGTRIFAMTFLGAFLSSAWVEVLGVLLAARFHIASAIPLLRAASGGLMLFVFAAGMLGTVTANVLNIYTGATSLLTLDVRMSRGVATIVVGVLGAVFAYLGERGFSGYYENFLLLLSYWVAPWLGVVLVDTMRQSGSQERGVAPGVYAFLVGVVASIPFMSQTLYEGPVARALGGADLAYYIGFAVAALVYAVSLRPASRVRAMRTVQR